MLTDEADLMSRPEQGDVQTEEPYWLTTPGYLDKYIMVWENLAYHYAQGRELPEFIPDDEKIFECLAQKPEYSARISKVKTILEVEKQRRIEMKQPERLDRFINIWEKHVDRYTQGLNIPAWSFHDQIIYDHMVETPTYSSRIRAVRSTIDAELKERTQPREIPYWLARPGYLDTYIDVWGVATSEYVQGQCAPIFEPEDKKIWAHLTQDPTYANRARVIMDLIGNERDKRALANRIDKLKEEKWELEEKKRRIEEEKRRIEEKEFRVAEELRVAGQTYRDRFEF